ncbi:hypothetical protein [Sorangium sp. So ce861]|uniref:hypothetical protein n=1 Tax=Sorangium sp. So ce861 TaxID=3133323 RepID=UPI003F639CE8
MTGKPREPFDLERVRRNWERAAEPPRGELPSRLAQVEPPADALREARDLLDRIRVLSAQQLPAHERTLAPFFVEAAALLAGLEARPGDPPSADAKGEGAARARLGEVLEELEEILEVFATIQR